MGIGAGGMGMGARMRIFLGFCTLPIGPSAGAVGPMVFAAGPWAAPAAAGGTGGLSVVLYLLLRGVLVLCTGC